MLTCHIKPVSENIENIKTVFDAESPSNNDKILSIRVLIVKSINLVTFFRQKLIAKSKLQCLGRLSVSLKLGSEYNYYYVQW